MHCPSCAILIKETLDEMEGVESCAVEEGLATVRFDERKISEKSLISAIEAEGYKVNQ